MDINMIFNIVVAVVIVAIVAVLWYKGKKKEALKIIGHLVGIAEDKFGKGTGDFKYNYVMTELYPKLPSVIRSLVSPKVIDKWIEDKVNELQAKIEEETKK